MKSAKKLTDTWKQTKRVSSSFENKEEKFLFLPDSEFDDYLDDDCLQKAFDEFEKDDNCNTKERCDGGSALSQRARQSTENQQSTPIFEGSRRKSLRLLQKSALAKETPSLRLKQLTLPDINSKKERPVSSSPNQPRTLINDVAGSTLAAETSLPTRRSELSQSNLLMSTWGIPGPVCEKYAEYGITSMFEWQAECLNLENVLFGRNLVYSAPTSAGKTLVAELLMLKCVLERKKKAIMILPFVSVTQEKITNLRNLFEKAGVRVDGFMGNHSPPGGFSAVDIAVCTIEKANSLMNRLIEENELKSLGIIVVDELHMVGDSHRGYLLELLLTKVQYIQSNGIKQVDRPESSADAIQIIGMSATLPNLELLARWLRAALFCSQFRPVPLAECLKIGSSLYSARTMEVIRHFPKSIPVKGDQDHVIQLCLETVCDGHGVLVFCPTKAWCEKLAETIARGIFDFGKDDFPQTTDEIVNMRNKLRENLNAEKLGETLAHLRRSPAGLDKLLAKTVAFGVAFHHAGLTFDEREIIESAFRRGTIKVLTATSTLSSGVNLPARRVIIRTPTFHRGEPLGALAYKQMIGRAGRKGLDNEGESILICTENERTKASTLLQSQLPPVSSCLMKANGESNPSSSLKRAILEIIVSGVATSLLDVRRYFDCTMLASTLDPNGPDVEKTSIEQCLEFLAENEFIRLQVDEKNDPKNRENGRPEEQCYVATPLGRAVLASALSPDEGLIVFQELERARRCFVLENELHVVYQVTPIYLSDQWSNLNWHQFWQMWESLSPGFKRVGECVGVEERFLIRASRQGVRFSTEPKQIRQLAIHLRFYTALALHDLVNEMPLSEVAHKYGCNRGMLQSLQQAAGTFAGMVTVFCHKLGWTNMELLLAHFQNRLHFGIQQELCDLVRISCLNGLISRKLYDAGYKTVAAIANASVTSVANVLRNAGPFESSKIKEGETAKEAIQRGLGSTVFLPGKKGISELLAAQIIIGEAREILRHDLGVNKIEWNKELSPSDIKCELIIDPINDDDSKRIKQSLGLTENAANKIKGTNEDSKGNTSPRKLEHVICQYIPQILVKPNKILPLKHGRTELLDKNNSPLTSPDMGKPLKKKKNIENVSRMVCEIPSRKSNCSPIENNLSLTLKKFENRPTKNYTLCEDLPQSPIANTLHFDDSIDDVNHGEQPYLLNTTHFETKSLNLSILSEDSDRTPSDISDLLEESEKNVQENGLEIAPTFDGCLQNAQAFGPKKSIQGQLHIASSPASQSNNVADYFADDSVFLLAGLDGKPNSSAMYIAETEKKFTANNVENATLADDQDGFSEELFGGSNSNMLSEEDSRNSSRWESLETSELDMAVIYESHDIFSCRVIAPPTIDISDSNIKRNSIEPVESNEVGEDLECIPPTPPSKVLGRIKWKVTEKSGRSNLELADENISGVKKIEKLDQCKVFKQEITHRIFEDNMDVLGHQCHDQAKEFILQPITSGVKIVEINVAELKSFTQTWAKKSKFAFAFAGEKYVQERHPSSMIGPAKQKGKLVLPKADVVLPKLGLPVIRAYDEDVVIVGVAVCWDVHTAHYIDFSSIICTENNDDNSLLSAFLLKCFNHQDSHPTIIGYDLKEQYRALYHVIGSLPSNFLGQDPKVACWLLDPEAPKLSMHQIVEKYAPQFLLDLQDFDKQRIGGLALDIRDDGSARLRASTEAFLAFGLMDCLLDKLQNTGLRSAFDEIEMPSLLPLAKMELNGIGICCEKFEQAKEILETTLAELETLAFKLAGHEFSLASPKDVAKVLYSELKLSAIPNIDEEQFPVPLKERIIRGSSRNILKRLRSRSPSLEPFRTNKTTLQKMDACHGLPSIILEWRQINSSLHKIVLPMLKAKQYNDCLKLNRLYCTVSTFTATGRVTSSDPSVQMVPRDFSIRCPPESKTTSIASTSRSTSLYKRNANEPHVMSLRQAFIPFRDGILVAADYSQLELRVLAHLSQDKDLIKALNSGTDVFQTIAAQWKGCKIEKVTDEERQQAKQICYGMVYGIGAKSLGSNLHVEEGKAVEFLESFKSKYPGIQTFIQSTIEKCKRVGYVETIMGRRRYLPSISSSSVQAQQHAERQAVNSTVQGSAADIVKKAMIGIDKQLEDEFPQTKKPLVQKLWSERGHIRSSFIPPLGGFFVLQLHDELIYETSEEDAVQVAQIVKMNMEQTTQLSVKLVVKVKLGTSWGTLKEIDI